MNNDSAMRMPGFTAAASLYSRYYQYAMDWAESSVGQEVQMAIPPDGPDIPDVKCTQCINGWQTCKDLDENEYPRVCTMCGNCQLSTAPATLGQFRRTCVRGGLATTAGCTFCRNFPIHTPAPLPDLCLRFCASSLNPNDWSLTEC
jgi:hypothetical protein